MKKTKDAELFEGLISNPGTASDGMRVAREMLKDVVLQQGPAWEAALYHMSEYDSSQAQETIAQLINGENLPRFMEIFSSANQSMRQAVEGALVKLASRGEEEIGKTIRQAIKTKYGLDDAQIEVIVSDGKSVIDFMCPFVMRESERQEFHLEELVNEPDDRPTAAHVTAWVYRKSGKISHVVVSGHANHSVCKEISAKLAATNLRLGDQPKSSLYITGAALLFRTEHENPALPKTDGKIFPVDIKDPPLEDLIKQLREIEDLTGLLKVIEVRENTYEEVTASLEEIIQKNFEVKRPTLVRHENKGMDSRGVFVPFYDLTKASPEPLTIELDISDFGPDFPELLQLHAEEYIYEMVADAKRRRAIYAGWLEDDLGRFHGLAYEMFHRMTSSLGLPTSNRLVFDYIDLLESGRGDHNLPWSPNQQIEQRHLLMFTRSMRLQQFILGQHSTRPQLPSRLDPKFQAALALIQAPEYPVSGMRNFADATVQGGATLFHISLQEQVEWNLPNLIASDRTWLKHMEEILEQIDTSKPEKRAQAEAGNLQLFADSFLRGWPSVFLGSKALKDRYDKWCAEYRKKTWQAIRDQLFSRGMRMEPLSSDNVVFNVRRLSPKRLEITPYYLANQRTFLVCLDRGYGMTYYINPWQHRRITRTKSESATQKREQYLQVFDKGIHNLNLGNYPEALEDFKQAIRMYPIAAGESLLNHYWQENFRDTHKEFDSFMNLAAALIDFEHAPQRSAQIFSQFISKYPDFLADPYLYLGFFEHVKAEQFFATKHQLLELLESRNARINDLRKDGTLVPEDANNSRGNYKVIGGANLTRMITEELNEQAEKLNQLNTNIGLQERLVWEDLERNPNEDIKHALKLNNGYVTKVFQARKLNLSEHCKKLVLPLYQVLRARAFMDIYSGMAKGLYQGGESMIDQLNTRDDIAQHNVLERLMDLLSTYINQPHLSPDDLKPLTDSYEFLENLHVIDSITRENIIRHRFDEVLGHCIRNAFKAYEGAVKINMGLTEVRRLYTDCIGYTTNYKDAIKSLISIDKVILNNAFPGVGFNVLDTKLMQFDRVGLNENTHTIDVILADGTHKPILEYPEINAEIGQYLTGEFGSNDFIAQLRSNGLRLPYALLYTPMQLPPVSRHWRNLLQDLTPWLIQSFAHLGLLPLAGKEINREAALKEFDDKDVVENISVDLDDVCNTFLEGRLHQVRNQGMIQLVEL